MSNLSMKLDKIAALLQEMIARMDAHEQAVDAEQNRTGATPMRAGTTAPLETDAASSPVLPANFDDRQFGKPIVAKRGPGRPRKHV